MSATHRRRELSVTRSTRPPIELYTLGALDLRAGRRGAANAAILAGAKRFALLAYLALLPPGLIRRDSLVALFWPDRDVGHSRSALRALLHQLRASLGAEVVSTVGDESVGLNRVRVWCDATAFASACEAGRCEEALALYRGPFLPGFYLPGCTAFGDWADNQRSHLHSEAVAAADRLVTARRASGDMTSAMRWARHRLELAPYQESGLRTLVTLLTAAGDRAEALSVYAHFKDRLVADLHLTPTSETVQLVAAPSSGPGATGTFPRSQTSIS